MTISVRYLSEEAIEHDTEALLSEFSHARGVILEPPIPIEDIIEKYLKLRIEFDDLHERVGVPRKGPEPEIFGAIWVHKREICIDQSLDPEEHPGVEGRYRFTLAHEGGGHWRLHRGYAAANPDQGELINGHSKPTVICRSGQSRERIEWQADIYASCILMPERMVREVWRRRFQSNNPFIFELMKHSPFARRPHWNGPRSFGQVVREMIGPDQYDHGYIFDRVAKEFAPIFGVSAQAMRIRLEKLGLLLHDVPRQRPLSSGS